MLPWQPIETAPKDGTTLILSDGVLVQPGGWNSDLDYGADYEGQFKCAGWWFLDEDMNPTHWMPFPKPSKP